MEQDKENWHHMVSVEDLGGLKRNINIVYDDIGVKMALDKALDIVKKQVQVKGYRKGKAPKNLVKNVHKQKIKDMAVSLLSQEGFLHACYENKISPLNEPNIKNFDFNIDGTFYCNIETEIRPEITPSGYIGLNLTERDIDVDKIYQDILSNLKSQYISRIEKEVIENGDQVSLDFVTLANGKEISSGKNKSFIIKDNQDPPFGKNLIGKKVGEELEEKNKLPENIPNYSGKEVDISIKINSCYSILDITNEELVEKTKYPSYEELVNSIKNAAQNEANRQQKAFLEEQVVDKLLEMHNFEVPDSWVKDEEEYLVKQLNIKELDDSMKNRIKDMSVRNVGRSFILEEIYETEKSLKITKDEINNILEHEAKNMGITRNALEKDLKTKGLMSGVIGMIKHKKVIDLILSQAQYIKEEKNGTESK